MIFLDVGAHEGQTLKEVTDPRYGFTEIHAFEPMPKQYEVLTREWSGHPRVFLHKYGLGSESRLDKIYGSNEQMEASIFSRKNDVDESIETVCEFRKASAVVFTFGNHSPLDPLSGPLFVKLNCEGAEIAILDDLIDNNMLNRIAAMLIDFDIRKVPGFEHEADRIIARLAEVGFDRYALAEDVMVGETHQDRIRAWLDGVLAR